MQRGYTLPMQLIPRIFIAMLVLLGGLSGPARSDEPVTVFAAASTQQAVEAVLAQCQSKLGLMCRGVYAASSTLARQIAGGAPADIYISANMKWMRYLDENKYVVPSSIQVLAANRLVVIAPSKSTVSFKSVQDLITWLASDRIAVGDPEHVPAGIYAKQTLVSLKAWPALEGKLLRMPNVRAALAVVSRGEAAAGIVYGTDAGVSDDVKIVYRFDNNLHDPIRYPIANVMGRDTEAARRVLEMFISTLGRDAFKAAGFDIEGG